VITLAIDKDVRRLLHDPPTFAVFPCHRSGNLFLIKITGIVTDMEPMESALSGPMQPQGAFK
jgi:hypothetical protein